MQKRLTNHHHHQCFNRWANHNQGALCSKYIKPIETHYGWPDTRYHNTKDLTIPGYTLDSESTQRRWSRYWCAHFKLSQRSEVSWWYFVSLYQNKQKIDVTYSRHNREAISDRYDVRCCWWKFKIQYTNEINWRMKNRVINWWIN